MHHLLFCEPYTLSTRELRTGLQFAVVDSFYSALLRAPKRYRPGKRRRGNAYLFGPLHRLESYEYLGSHGNDGSQTGFIDLDLFEPGHDVRGVIREVYRAKRYDWNDRVALRQVRAAVPCVLFIGETVGGDVGAQLHAHYTRGQIDSLIIDNDYFFRPEEEPARRQRRESVAGPSRRSLNRRIVGRT
jgi:hypothetical protein